MSTFRRVGAAAVVWSLVGCGSSTTEPGAAPVPIASPSKAPSEAGPRFRVVNGSPGTGNIDVYVFPQGSLRTTVPTFANVPFGGITPYVSEPNGIFNVDVLRARAVGTATAIASGAAVNQRIGQLDEGQTNSMNGSIVISGTNLNGTRNLQYFLEPFEPAGRSALVVHHASPAATVITRGGPIGIGVYSATTYPPGTAVTAIPPRATSELFSLSFVQNPAAVAEPNSVTAFGGMFYVTPFPVAPLPAAVGFAVGLPNTGAAEHASLVSVLANAALSETANENSPYANQNALTNNSSETVPAGTHISEYLIDADQNGNVGLIGTIDP